MSVNKFKVGDVVKCVDDADISHLTFGEEYTVVKIHDEMIKVDNDMCFYYRPNRFELSDSDETSQPPKFKEGDMVYLIGFNYFKPCKLTPSNCEDLPLKLEVVMDNNDYETFTANGCYTPKDVEPSLVLATEENRQMLNRLLGVEYEPVKLTGSDLAKKLLKNKPQTCYMSDTSDDIALSNKCIDLIAKFECGRFITMSGIRWEYAVPCDQHGRILEDE